MKNKRFEECFQQYSHVVIKMAAGKTGSVQTAQEICQQVFLAFYKNMEKIDRDLEKAWLFRAAQNAVIDYYRRSSTQREVVTGYCSYQETSACPSEESIALYEEKMFHREFMERILSEVSRVNQMWYQVLVLVCVEGLSHQEAARELKISLPVLRARLFRARDYVRKHFGQEYKELQGR